jgi:hypothetical protein
VSQVRAARMARSRLRQLIDRYHLGRRRGDEEA